MEFHFSYKFVTKFKKLDMNVIIISERRRDEVNAKQRRFKTKEALRQKADINRRTAE